MEPKVKTYINRATFANLMLDKYYPNSPNLVVSDIGSGYGHMQAKIESLGAQWQPFDYYKKMDFSIEWNLNDPTPENSNKAGVAIFLEVLEHLPNPLLSLQNIADHIENEGILILTTPNPQCSKNMLNLFLKGTLYAFQKKHLQEYHVFTPWEHIVKHFLESVGFEVLEYAIVDTNYQKRKAKSIKDWFKLQIEKIIEKRNPLSIGMSYGIVAKKKRI